MVVRFNLSQLFQDGGFFIGGIFKLAALNVQIRGLDVLGQEK